jgi:hypothetical protein
VVWFLGYWEQHINLLGPRADAIGDSPHPFGIETVQPNPVVAQDHTNIFVR